MRKSASKLSESKARLHKLIAAIIAALTILTVVFFVIFGSKVARRVKLEAGSPLTLECFFKGKEVPQGAEFVTDTNEIHMDVPGKYQIQIKLEDRVYKSELKVVDTVAPTAKPKENGKAWMGVAPVAEKYITDLQDATKVEASWRVEPDTSKEGEARGTVLLTDAGGNTAAIDVAVTVLHDTEAPTISGIKDYDLFVGEKLEYATAVKVSDDKDDEPELVVDDSSLIRNEAGTYTIIYTATDGAGNKTVKNCTITLKADTNAPKIEGVNNYKTCVGKEVDYKSSVSVADDHDYAPTLEIEDSKVDFSAAGTYTVTYTAKDLAGNQTVKTANVVVVEDTEGPQITDIENKTVLFGTEMDYKSVTVKDDWDTSPALTVSGEVDFNTEGSYTVTYTATDASGNTTVKKRIIKVEKDTTPPTIKVKDFSVYIGASVSYKANAEVTDDFDENPKLSIDNSSVDINTPGTYEVIYTATDASGNTSKATAKFVVRSEPTNEEEVIIRANEVLGSIIDASMSDLQKVQAIYKWVKKSINYTGSSNKDNWIKGAYDGFKKRSGDCYTFYAVSRALLTQAGIDNQEVRKVKKTASASNHWWNLVYVNDGWYHMDTTPFKKGTNRICLLTDKELADYDKKTNWAEHNFDGSLHPERATKSLQDQIKY